MKKKKWIRVISVVVCLFLVVPTFVIIPMSFGSSSFIEFPPRGFSMQWYERFFSDSAWMSALMQSLKVGAFTTVLSLFLGITASEGLVRVKFPGKKILEQVYQLPLIIPIIVMAIAMYNFQTQIQLKGSLTGLVLAHTLLGLPYVVSAVYSRRVSLDKNMELASMNLGGTPFYTMVHITLPLIRPAIFSGALFAFASSFDEVVMSMFLCGIDNETLPKKIWDSVRSELDPTITAIASILIMVITLIMVASSILEYRKENLARTK